ncbi:hypothetical protein [Flyfo microvirus Tbat2_95]|nr:hypothetical protein [Flyfo microvirus Tbat2_95]
MQKLFDLRDWATIGGEGKEDQVIPFTGDAERTRNVYLDVNAPEPVKLWVIDARGNEWFLARVVGRDKLHFIAQGDFQLASSGEVFVMFDDGVKTHTEDMGEATFTRLHERRVMSPEVAAMRAIALENQRTIALMHANQLEAIRNENNRAHVARSIGDHASERETAVSGGAEAAGVEQSAAGSGSDPASASEPVSGSGADAKPAVPADKKVSGAAVKGAS